MNIHLKTNHFAKIFLAVLWFLTGQTSISFAGNLASKASSAHSNKKIISANKRLKTISLNQLLHSKKHISHNKKELKIQTSIINPTQKPKHRFLIQGGLHGNEIVAKNFVQWLAKRYDRGESLLNQFSTTTVAFDFLSEANPDGIQKNSRTNSADINLNRNFSTLWGMTKENPGKKPFSEPETQAIKDLFQHRNYTGAVDVHGYINWVVAPSSPEFFKNQMKQSPRNLPKINQSQFFEYKRWVSSLKNELHALGQYELKTAGALGDGGAFEDWAFWEAKTMAFCLELSSNRRWVRNPKSITKNAEKTDRFLQYEKYIHTMFKHAINIKNQTLLSQIKQ